MDTRDIKQMADVEHTIAQGQKNAQKANVGRTILT